jgi:hypothetical protein
MSVSAEAGRKRARVFAFVVAAAFVAIAAASWWSGRVNLREGSRVVSQGGAPLAITHIPTTYHAVFRIDYLAGPKTTVGTESVWAERPFSSRVESLAGPPPGGKLQTLRQSTFGVLASSSARSEPLNITVPPSLSSGDLRIDAVLDYAVREKLILRRERREVFGRPCQVYRAGGPVIAGDLTPYKGGTGDYADLCVDRNGIVIEEFWVKDSEPVRRRTATLVEIDPSLTEKTFRIEVPEKPGMDRGAVVPVKEGTGKGELWTLPDSPKGFEKVGRFGVLISSQALPRLSALAPSAAAASTSDVYVGGPDLIVVDQDPSLAQLINLESRPTRKVRIKGFTNAKLIVDARMSEVRASAPDGSIVRVFGTVPPSKLIELARRLELEEV